MSAETLRSFESSGEEVFDELMVDYSEAMHDYQRALRGYIMLRYEENVSAHTTRLEDIDLNTPYAQQPDQLARDALAVWIHTEKLSMAQRDLHSMEREWDQEHRDDISGLLGRKVKVAAIDPDRSSIGTSKLNESGEYDGLGQWHDTVAGRLTGLNLDLDTGGGVVVKKPFSKKHYSAYPLLSPNTACEPLYKIEFLD
ncbi:MAG: hypothetical protein U5L95_03665 [Candidatus Saccharibacteria bacterium]|nr:hypothetical protein [Candidatus Saccharibacteria bacterium]